MDSRVDRRRGRQCWVVLYPDHDQDPYHRYEDHPQPRVVG